MEMESNHTSWSEVKKRREWIDRDATSNGIGPVCIECRKLIDWHPVDHDIDCEYAGPVVVVNKAFLEYVLEVLKDPEEEDWMYDRMTAMLRLRKTLDE